MDENSEVLNNIQDADQQLNNPTAEPAPEVLNQVTTSPDKSMYTSAVKPTQPIGEKDHASEIANNAISNAEAQQTFSYNSQASKNYSTDVNTSTTLSNNAELKGTFESEYTMGDQYKATDDADYTWNRLAEEMAQTNYDQQASQARYESIQAKQEIDKAAASAFNNYFASEYSARQTQDKMGWSGGQQTASDLQVAFLQAETAANMYTQEEMQKYGVDTKLGIARMYAEADQKALALQYYQDAVDLAVKEANETGCYVPPEASEMMKQQKVADEILANPYSSDAEKARARGVNAAAQAYYDSKGFSHWDVYDEKTGEVVTRYYGIQTLQYLTYEETVRNNKVNEELQRQANDIAQSAAGAAWAGVGVAKAQLRATIAMQNQLEINNALQSGQAVEADTTTNSTANLKNLITGVKDVAKILSSSKGKVTKDNEKQIKQIIKSSTTPTKTKTITSTSANIGGTTYKVPTSYQKNFKITNSTIYRQVGNQMYAINLGNDNSIDSMVPLSS